ncbi:hypothetical protein PLANTIT3_61023 [Plantibacter sp. T3]|nr:hypothetical protein PLANTIT3_61023 [Plantibacter sp. T3]
MGDRLPDRNDHAHRGSDPRRVGRLRRLPGRRPAVLGDAHGLGPHHRCADHPSTARRHRARNHGDRRRHRRELDRLRSARRTLVVRRHQSEPVRGAHPRHGSPLVDLVRAIFDTRAGRRGQSGLTALGRKTTGQRRGGRRAG